jgi:uncharacterized protein YbjT (DUF2867 family)
LITGATGQQGGAVARALAGKGFKVRAMTRKPQGEAAKALAALGAEITTGDLEDAASLERALTGAWGVFAVQTFWERGVKGEEEQGTRLAQLAYRLGVQHFVYSSVVGHQKTGILHFENKWRIEETVRGLKFLSHDPAQSSWRTPVLAARVTRSCRLSSRHGPPDDRLRTSARSACVHPRWPR